MLKQILFTGTILISQLDLPIDRLFPPKVERSDLTFFNDRLSPYMIHVTTEHDDPTCSPIKKGWAHYDRRSRTVCLPQGAPRYSLHHELIHALHFTCNVEPGVMSRMHPELKSNLTTLQKEGYRSYYSQMLQTLGPNADKYLSKNGIPIWEEEALQLERLDRNEILHLFKRFCEVKVPLTDF